MSEIIINNIELGDTGSESRDKLNNNNRVLKESVDSLDAATVKKTDVTQVLGTSTNKVPSEKAISNTLANYPKKNEVLIGTILKGNKANATEIKAVTNPKGGDTYKAIDTGHYWTFDGSQWNDIGNILPDDLAPKVDANGNKVVYAADGKIEYETQFSDKSNTAPASSLLNKLNNNLYNSSEGNKETIPYTGLKARTSAEPSQWFYINHELLRGKQISKIKINIVKAGTMSVLFGKNIGSISNYTFTKQVFDVVPGLNEIVLNKQLAPDETLGFFDYTDTATFTFGATNTLNPIGGGMIQRTITTGVWSSPNPQLDLSIGVFEISDLPTGDIPDIKNRITILENSESTNLLKGKSFSVLADSIGTFKDKIADGHAYFYPIGDVTNWLQTWWGLLTTDKYGMKLIANASYSGGTLTSGTGGIAIPDFVPKLGGIPDYIFLFMGTNDYTRKVAIGELNFYMFDRTKFIQAACDLVSKILTTYPKSHIVLMSPLQRNVSTATNGKNPNKIADDDINFLYDYKDAYQKVSQIYGVQFVDMFKCGINFHNLSENTIDLLHPNAKGMSVIANFVYRNIAMYL